MAGLPDSIDRIESSPADNDRFAEWVGLRFVVVVVPRVDDVDLTCIPKRVASS